jgi:hypothetical protein
LVHRKLDEYFLDGEEAFVTIGAEDLEYLTALENQYLAQFNSCIDEPKDLLAPHTLEASPAEESEMLHEIEVGLS